MRSLIDKQQQTRQKGKASKLYCCFVTSGKPSILYRVLCFVVWHCCGRCWKILVCVGKSWILSSDSAAVRSSQGISAISTCLMGVKQGCPLSPTLFGLYVGGWKSTCWKLLILMHLHSWELWCHCFYMLMTSSDVCERSRTSKAAECTCKLSVNSVNLQSTSARQRW